MARQIRNIKERYPDAKIVEEVFTRTRMDRREWKKFMKIIKSGDRIGFDSVSRMNGNAADGVAEYERLYNMGVSLCFLKEPHIDTDTYRKHLKPMGSNVHFILEGVNRYLLELAKEQIKLAFEQAEKEVTDLHQRTGENPCAVLNKSVNRIVTEVPGIVCIVYDLTPKPCGTIDAAVKVLVEPFTFL